MRRLLFFAFLFSSLKSQAASSVPAIKPSTDTLISDLLFDSSLVFDNWKDLNAYYRQHSSQLFYFTNQQSEKIKDPARKKFFRDSVRLLNQDLYTVIVMKSLKKMPKDENSMVLLPYNVAFSRFVDPASRLKLYYEYPAHVRNSTIGKRTYSQISMFSSKNQQVIDPSLLQTSMLSTVTNSQFSMLKVLQKCYQPYVLLILGASWCSPCRHQDMELKRSIGLIDTTKVKIIGISIDESVEAWKNALAQDKLPWDNYLLAKGQNSVLYKLFTPDGIPYNVLMDRNQLILQNHAQVTTVLKSLSSDIYKGSK